MRQKNIQQSLDELFEARVPSKKIKPRRNSRIEHAEVRRLSPSVAAVKMVRKSALNSAGEPRAVCREWMLWLLQCGLIERSHGPMSQSGLYTDFT